MQKSPQARGGEGSWGKHSAFTALWMTTPRTLMTTKEEPSESKGRNPQEEKLDSIRGDFFPRGTTGPMLTGRRGKGLQCLKPARKYLKGKKKSSKSRLQDDNSNRKSSNQLEGLLRAQECLWLVEQ